MTWLRLLAWIGPKLWPWLAPRLAVAAWIAAGVVGLYLALWAYILGKSQ